VKNLKNQAYKRMQQENSTQGAVEKYCEARREEKRVHKKKKGITINKN
jgi:hypothetical protein